MKKIIYRNLANDCIKNFLLIISTISIIIWVLQAVNFLDIVVEDGHGFLVYFNYTLLSFPKILGRIFPFALFLAFSYVFIKYENKNELIIFWKIGINKINFINFFIKFSLIFVLLNLILNSVVTPYTQDKARSFIRSSNLDFFESILRPKKFIDIIDNLTIYFDEKDNNNIKNIILHERSGITETQTTFAKNAIIDVSGDQKLLVLFNGNSIKNVNGDISEFKFSKTNFIISKFNTKTTTFQKTQENSTLELIICSLLQANLKNKFIKTEITEINNCLSENLEKIYEELYSRVIKPIYNILLILISLLLILKSKDDPTFKINNYKIYTLGFLFIVFLESSSKFVSTNLLQNIFLLILPFFLIFTTYVGFLRILKN